MAFNVSFNGTTYPLPSVGDRIYATYINTFLTAVANNALAKSGGTFTLTADVNFGATYGPVVAYIKSRSSNIASTGVFRLANDEGIAWRNAANSANLLLKLNSSNRLELDGVAIPTISSTDTFTNKTISGASNTISNVSLTSGVTGTLPVANGGTGITAFGTGVATALGQNVTGSGSIVLGSGATLTSPAITTPTGIVKGDVGLGNVDNTSDATKNSATATLTNKTISGASNTITNVSLTTGVTGTLPIANGGTGQTVANDALNALLPSQTSNANKVLQTDGTNTSWASVAATVTTTRGDLIRRGASADERFSAVTNNRVVRGNGTDVVSGQIDHQDFFTDGAAADASTRGILTTGSQTIAGEKTWNGGIKFATSGGTATNLNFFEEHSYTATWQCSTAEPTTTIKVTRLGNLIFLDPGALNHTLAGGASTFNIKAGSELPSRFCPPVDIYTQVMVTDNGSAQNTPGLLVVLTTGVIQLYKDVAGNNFTNGATAGLGSTASGRLISSICYKKT